MPALDTTNPLTLYCLELNEDNQAYGVNQSGLSKEKIMLVDSYVDNHYLKAVLDTGATCSIISEHAASRYKFKISKSNETIRTADNSVTPIVGKIRNAKVIVQGRVAYLGKSQVADQIN